MQDFAKMKITGGNKYSLSYNTVYEKNDINDSIINYTGENINDILDEIKILNNEEKYKNIIHDKKIIIYQCIKYTVFIILEI